MAVFLQNGALIQNGTYESDVVTNIDSNFFLAVDIPSPYKLVTTGAGNYTLDNCDIYEIENVSGGDVYIFLINGSTLPTILNETNGAIIVISVAPITAPSLIDGTRVQIFNETKAVEIDNSVVSGGGGYSFSANLSDANIDAGDVLRLRATYQSGVTAKEPIEVVGVMTTTGLSFITSQIDDDIYIGYGYDGSAITKFSADYVDNEFDVVTTSNFEAKELYAWYVYNLTTEDGIRLFFDAVTPIDSANLRINNDVLNVYFDITNSDNVYQTDNIRMFRTDGAYPVKDPTTGGGGIDVVWRNQIFIAETGTSGLTPSESALLNNVIDILADTDELQTNQGDWTTATGFSTSTDITNSQTAIIAEIDANETKIDTLQTDTTAIKAKTDTMPSYVYVDTDDGLPTGDGSEANPYDNFDDAKTMADSNGAKTIYVIGDATIGVNLKNYYIKGDSSRASIDLNGQNVDGSLFYGLVIKGSASEPNNPKGWGAVNCTFENVGGIQGVYRDCLLKGTNTIADGGVVDFISCTSGVAGLGRPTINGNNGAMLMLSLRDWLGGGLTLVNFTHAANETTVHGEGIKLTLDSTVTAGTFSIRGKGQFTDNSVGATIDTSAFIEVQDQSKQIKEVWQMHGLEEGNPMTVTPTSRVTQDNSIDQTISGDGETSSTVERNQ